MSGNLTWSDLPSLRRRARVPRPALASIRKPRWRQKSRDSRAESLPELPRHGAARDIPPAPMFLSGESGPHQLRVIGAKLFPLRSDDYAKSVRSSLFNSRLQKSRRKKRRQDAGRATQKRTTPWLPRFTVLVGFGPTSPSSPGKCRPIPAPRPTDLNPKRG